MPEVAQIFSGVQVGAESTSGTAVSASKLMSYLSLEPDFELQFNTFQPIGQVVPSSVTPGKDSTVFNVTGKGSYSELIVPLCSVLTNVSPSTVETTARLWDFIPLGRSEDTVKSYTVEYGSATRAQKNTYGLFNGLTLTFNREEGIEVGGSAFGQQMQDNITLTAGPTAYEDKPILPTHLDVYVDTTSGGLGGTKLLRDFNAEFSISDRWGQVWPINSANASFTSHVATMPTVTLKLTVEADSSGMAYLVNARAGDTRYVRLAAVAPSAYGFAGAGTAPYQLLIDMAGKINEVKFTEVDGIKCVDYTFTAIYDTAWSSGRYLRVQLQNKTAAL